MCDEEDAIDGGDATRDASGVSDASDASDARIASIWRLSVSSKYRRCGIGTMLLAAAENHARQAAAFDALTLETGNRAAWKFYRACGFEASDESPGTFVKPLAEISALHGSSITS
jgi:ribosomal protein S18 acetylase RimI-like enzyme